MADLFRRLMYELGTGRAITNARGNHDEETLLLARIDALGRRVEVAATEIVNAA